MSEHTVKVAIIVGAIIFGSFSTLANTVSVQVAEAMKTADVDLCETEITLVEADSKLVIETAGQVGVAIGRNSLDVLEDAFTYKAVGYVSSKVLNQFSYKTPILFSPLYFNLLGKALNRAGMREVADVKGRIFEDVSAERKRDAFDRLKDVQISGKVALFMWEGLVKAFHLNETGLEMEELTNISREARYESVNDFIAARRALLENIRHKSQIVEFVRLSLDVGLKLSYGHGRKLGGLLIFTLPIAATVGAVVEYGLGYSGITEQVLYWGVHAAGFLASGLIGQAVIAPRSQFLTKYYRKWFNFQNRRALRAANLISNDGTEAQLFIDAAFLEELEVVNESVTLEKIDSLAPDLPLDPRNRAEVDLALNSYRNRIQEMMGLSSAYMEQVIEGWRKTSASMGQPGLALAKIFDSESSKSWVIPDNIEGAIIEYRTTIDKVYSKVIESREEMIALGEKHAEFINYLKRYLEATKPYLSPEQQQKANEVLSSLYKSRQLISMLLATIKRHIEIFETEQRIVSDSLMAVRAYQSAQSLSRGQQRAVLEFLQTVESRIADQQDQINIGEGGE